MAVPRFLLSQAARPSGRFAGAVALLLNRANAAENCAAIEALDVREDHRVLDIGFGGGASFPELLLRCTKGRVAGVDPSAEMVGRALRLWAHEVRDGRIQAEEASVASLPFPDAAFDRALAVNSVYFWPDLEGDLREIRRVLGPGAGFVATCVSPDLLRRVGFQTMGFRVEEVPVYADACRAVFSAVEVRSAGDRKGTQLVCADV